MSRYFDDKCYEFPNNVTWMIGIMSNNEMRRKGYSFIRKRAYIKCVRNRGRL